MNIGKMKNIVILKDLPSNIIEEAIVVLKENQKIRKPELVENKADRFKSSDKIINTKDYVVKEAEMIVSNYISNIEVPNKSNKTAKKLEKKYNRLKKLTAILGMLTFLLIIKTLI